MPFATRAPVAMVAALLFIRLADESAGFLTAGTFEAWRSDLGFTYTQASIILVVAAPGAMFGNVFAVAADYRSRRVIAAGGAFGYAVSLLMFGLGTSFWMLVASSFLFGCASTAMVDGAELALVDVAGDDLAPALARTNFFGAIGDLLGPLVLIAFAVTGFGWRAPILVGAVLMTAFGVLLAATPIPPPQRHPEQPNARASIRDVIVDGRVWYCALVLLLMGPLDEDYFAFLIAHLERARGLSPAAATSVTLVAVLGGMAGYWWSGRPGNEPGPRTVFRAASVLTLSVFAGALASNAGAVVPAMFAFGWAQARVWVALQARMFGLRPGQNGTVKAVITTIEFTGVALTILVGVASDRFGLTGGMVSYGLIATAMWILVAVGEPSVRRRADEDPDADAYARS